jgi:hypothetical protein
MALRPAVGGLSEIRLRAGRFRKDRRRRASAVFALSHRWLRDHPLQSVELCVDSDYRSYAIRMVAAVIKRKDITYTPISPVPRTRRAAEKIGFRRYSNGQLVFAPALSRSQRGDAVLEYSYALPEAALLSADERRLLEEHAGLGYRPLICVKGGKATPFVFVEGWILKDLVPYWQLVYCRSIDDRADWAGSLGCCARA